MVSPTGSRWLPLALAGLGLALIALVAVPGAEAVRVLDSPDRLPEAVHAYGAAQIDDEAYLVGGSRGQGYLDEITVVRSDGTANTVAQLPTELLSPAAATHGGQVYVFGGAERSASSDLPQTTRDIHRFDPATGEAERVLDAQLPDPVAGASAVNVGGTIYVLGGLSIQPDQEDQIDFVDTIAAFDPETGEVSELDARLPTGRAQASAIATGGQILYLGGHAEAGPDTCPEGASTCFVGDVLRISPSEDRVGTIGELPTPLRWAGAALHDGTVYLLGGCRNNCGAHAGTAAIQTVDVESGQARELPVTMPLTGGRHAAFLQGDVAWIPGGVQATEDGSTDHDRIVRIQLGPTRPWAPIEVAAEPVQGGVHLSWEAPTYDGGEDVTSYIVERARGAREPTRLDQVPEPRFRDTNVSQGVTYTYRVRAENPHGLSSPSAETLVRPTEVPDPPAVNARGGDGKIVAHWSPPEDDGGTEVTAYRVFAYLPDSDADLERCASACWGKVSNTTSRATITDVQGEAVENGQTYHVRVQARNANGWSLPSEPVEAEAKPVPDAPVGLEASPSEDGDRQVELTWQAPDEDAGSYVVHRGPTLADMAEIGTARDTTFVDEGPIPEGEPVIYAVAARNGDAEGPFSQPTSIVFATPPGEVDALEARWTGSHVEVSWSAPNETGGQPVQTYEVARTRGVEDPEEADAEIHRTAVTRYQDGNPPRDNKPVTYHVRAVTEAGEGPWAFEQVRVPLTQDSRPPVPALAAHPTKVDAGERVVFDASGSEDDGDIVAYNFTFGDDEGTGWRSSPRVTYTYDEDGVYEATVTIRDTDGLESSAQATIAVGPPQNPDTNTSTDELPQDPGSGTQDTPLGLGIVVASLAAAGCLRRRA